MSRISYCWLIYVYLVKCFKIIHCFMVIYNADYLYINVKSHLFCMIWNGQLLVFRSVDSVGIGNHQLSDFHYGVMKALWTDGTSLYKYYIQESSVFPMYLHILFIYNVCWCLFIGNRNSVKQYYEMLLSIVPCIMCWALKTVLFGTQYYAQ